MLQSQAQYVARAYLEEILAQGYSDPDAVEAGENRASFDDVDDYNGLSVNGCLSTSAACPSLGTCACDQAGAPMDDLKGYTVTVAVAPTTLGAVGALRVDVNVRHTVHPNVNVTFSSYRTNY